MTEPVGGVTRRQLLAGGAGAAGLLALGSCAQTGTTAVGATSAAVRETERHRRRNGARVRSVALTASIETVDLGGQAVDAWTYNGMLPGPLLRVRAGDVLRVSLHNGLPEETTIHWHGIALRNDMDGVPRVTQRAVQPGATFTYEFTAADPGTYWFHPHVGTQLDKGLYAPLLVDDPSDPGNYDVEHTIVLDDWILGVGDNPDAVLDQLRQGMQGMGHSGHDMTNSPDTGGMGMAGPGSKLLGGDTGDVAYPLYLANGRIADAPLPLTAKPGQRVRLRLINAGADTAFRVALGGHRLVVTHSDGFPVVPVTTDALLIGMGERYDAIVTAKNGVFPLAATAEGKQGQALAALTTAPGSRLRSKDRPRELDGRVATLADLRATAPAALSRRRADRTLDVHLGGSMMDYRWTINGKTFDDQRPLPVRQGERVRLRFTNRSTMWHPMHLHGHTMQIASRGGATVRKDTFAVRPRETIEADLDANNPGQWALHCHNVYHMEAGMMTTLSYRS